MTARAMASLCFSPPDRAAQPDPFQHLFDIGGVVGLAPARQPQRQGGVLEGGQMVQQAEILKHHPHAAPKSGDVAPVDV